MKVDAGSYLKSSKKTRLQNGEEVVLREKTFTSSEEVPQSVNDYVRLLAVPLESPSLWVHVDSQGAEGG